MRAQQQTKMTVYVWKLNRGMGNEQAKQQK
jgi:hypothetical protein